MRDGDVELTPTEAAAQGLINSDPLRKVSIAMFRGSTQAHRISELRDRADAIRREMRRRKG